ncbi:MAG: hypothetical protein P8170_22500 [Gemmatimonadota bacterium]
MTSSESLRQPDALPRHFEIDPRGFDDAFLVHDECAIECRELSDRLEEVVRVNVPASTWMALARIEHELSKVWRQLVAATQNESRANRTTFSTFSAEP